MSVRDRKPGFADSRAARVIALAVFALCLAALGYLHRNDLFPAEPADTVAQANPQFIACRGERVGHVDTMLAEGVIDHARHQQFKERAIAYCAAQFPPGAPAQ